ncbi:MAG: hypothetical protein J7521_05310 [Caulobacter sp.]|nr:hypothetical protein [Caulobacter sp.]
MQSLFRLRATATLMFAALCLTACASGPPQDGPRGDWGRQPRPRPPGDGGEGPHAPRQQLFISPAGEPFRAPPGAPYPVAAWFTGADTDHDGVLTRDEFVADAVRFFAVVDTDHNGVIDGFEVSNYENHIVPEILQGFRGAPGGGENGGPPGGGRSRGGRGGHGGERGGGGMGGGDMNGPPSGGGRRGGGSLMGGMLQGATPYSLLAEPQPVMGAEADFDRRISRDEAIRAAKARFALLDKDGDGRLRLADLPHTPAQARFETAPDAGQPPRRR